MASVHRKVGFVDFNGKLLNSMRAVSREVDRAIDAFCVIRNLEKDGFPERMLSYYYLRAIELSLKQPSVICEIPVPSAKGKRWVCHVDALVFDDDAAVFCEFKRWRRSNRCWPGLATDAVRLKHLLPSLRRRFRVDGRAVYVLYGSDCWRNEAVKMWKGEPTTKRSRPLPDVFERMHREACRVSSIKGDGYDCFDFTWAVDEITP